MAYEHLKEYEKFETVYQAFKAKHPTLEEANPEFSALSKRIAKNVARGKAEQQKMFANMFG